ncbi:two-component sensor histidine kinase [Actinomadura rubrobrunea]|uniref:histidine kinase n=1 Tax=Actinomadura rubrobrunea TaxID=115335 RepID=A0A9W6PWG5_9ACTN|nr:HAMP domain-containing sensor histidine kinase [Actinomadura rubrobrunea]GLW64451.1 two-component sensor histidine kinase [Actinomadura rubrobrunea]
MRLRPRSIRVRDTIVAAVLAVLVFGALAVGIDLAVRTSAKSHLLDETQTAGHRVSAAVRQGALRTPIPDFTGGRVLVQVVGPGGRVLDATRAASRYPPLSRAWPTPDRRVHDSVECPDDPRLPRCMAIEAIRVDTSPESAVVYAARPLPGYLVNGLLEAALTAAVLALSAAVAWITWRVVGRTLRPVAQIRTQLAEISATDLSRRVPESEAEDEIAELARTANETLERLERAVARQRQFASDASHELRTPIAGLRAKLEDAAMHPDDTDLRAAIRSALRDVDRLQSIVADLLLLARIGTVGAVQESIDLGQLTSSGLARRPPSRLEISTDLREDVRVRGVRVQLERLLGNLLDNAERYAASRVHVEVVREGSKAVLRVTDDGQGIPDVDRERIFERFTRLDSARSRDAGGAGLGLAIAREIAQAHGGSLRVEDWPRGARFALSLPLEMTKA